MIAKFKYIICAFCVIFSVAACVDNDDDVPMNYYTSTKLTAAGLLEENPEQFSDFIDVLKRTPYFSLLSTYGNFTLFAHTNDDMYKFVT